MEKRHSNFFNRFCQINFLKLISCEGRMSWFKIYYDLTPAFKIQICNVGFLSLIIGKKKHCEDGKRKQ